MPRDHRCLQSSGSTRRIAGNLYPILGSRPIVWDACRVEDRFPHLMAIFGDIRTLFHRQCASVRSCTRPSRSTPASLALLASRKL
jgi:hypothetical protein